MNSKKWILALVFTQFFIIAYLFYKNSEKMQILTETGKTSYVLGLDTAKNIKRQGIEIELESFYYGFKDGLKEESNLKPEIIQASRSRALQQARENSARNIQIKPGSLQQNEITSQPNQLGQKNGPPNSIEMYPNQRNSDPKTNPKNLSPVQRYAKEQLERKTPKSAPAK